MKYFDLDKNELDIEKAVDTGEFRSTKNLPKVKKAYQSFAQNDLKKTKSINVRVSEGDLLRLKARALEEGIPYQTYFTSIVHKHLRGQKTS